MNNKTYLIVATDLAQPYDFEDGGKKHEGITYYACVQILIDGKPAKVRLFKVGLACVAAGDVYSALYFDEYGRLIGGCD